MKELIKIVGLESLNTSEASIGEMIVLGRNVLLPLYNCDILPGHNLENIAVFQKYVEYCIVAFIDVSAIGWEGIGTKLVEGRGVECFGGTYVRDDVHYEFWIKCDRGIIFLDSRYRTSSSPFNDLDRKISFLVRDKDFIDTVLADLVKGGIT